MSELLKADRSLFSRYFNKSVDSALTNGFGKSSEYFDYFVRIAAYERLANARDVFSLTESQKRRFFLAFLEAVTKRHESLKKADLMTCYWAIRLGIEHGDVFRRVLPEKSAELDAAMALCENSDLPGWRKPSFAKRPAGTSSDLVDRAAEINDKAEKSRYLVRAANAAAAKDQFQLAIEILDKVEPPFRDRAWKFSKITSAAGRMGSLLSERRMTEANAVLESFAPDLQPYVILETFLRTRGLLTAKNGSSLKSLADRARAGFAGFKDFPDDTFFNPNRFSELQLVYFELGFESDALAVNGEAVASFNRLVKTLPAELRDGASKPGWSAFARPSLSRGTATQLDFVYRNFDKIRQNIGLVEDDTRRLWERQFLMRDLFWNNREAFLKRASN